MTCLAGKTAIITGASSGIGRAAARLFAHEGANLVLAARRADALALLTEEITLAGGSAVALAGDVKDESYAAHLVEQAMTRWGRLDIAFNNAGSLNTLGPITQMPLEQWHETLSVNLTGAFLGAKHQLRAMIAQGSGSLVFTSSVVGHTVGFPGMAAYAASKAGLIGLAQVLAAEHGADGIRVNAILPGGTDTPMGRTVTHTPDIERYVAGLHAQKRIAAPEEIARTVLHIVSDDASFMTGAAILVDGGISIYRS